MGLRVDPLAMERQAPGYEAHSVFFPILITKPLLVAVPTSTLVLRQGMILVTDIHVYKYYSKNKDHLRWISSTLMKLVHMPLRAFRHKPPFLYP